MSSIDLDCFKSKSNSFFSTKPSAVEANHLRNENYF